MRVSVFREQKKEEKKEKEREEEKIKSKLCPFMIANDLINHVRWGQYHILTPSSDVARVIRTLIFFHNILLFVHRDLHYFTRLQNSPHANN